MDNNIAIKVDNVSKKFCKYLKDSMFYGITDIGRNLLGLSSHSEKLKKNEFWAVKDISFEIKRGATVGLIGLNGSGKTTLLKMLNGIFWPDEGKIRIKGKVGALIAVGAGFHPLLTGRENIYVNGAILGMSRMEVNKKFNSIVDFADIGDFLDSPVKHYSSGMFIRLGFAVAIHSNPDILLIDEILAVGDINFQAKCIDKLKELDNQGVTKIFVSHNLSSVELICKDTIYLTKGKLSYYGKTRDVISEFKKNILIQPENQSEVNQLRYGTKEIEIIKVEFLDNAQSERYFFCRGESIQIKITFNAKGIIREPHFSVGFFTDQGVLISKAITYDHGFPTGVIHGQGTITYSIKSLPLNVGKYAVTIGCWDATGQIPYDHLEKAYSLFIEEGAINNNIKERYGYVYIPSTWEINKK